MNFKCSTCGKSFAFQSEWRRHISVHAQSDAPDIGSIVSDVIDTFTSSSDSSTDCGSSDGGSSGDCS